MNTYYRFPLNFSDLIQRKELPQTDLVTSIRQNVYLILTSEFGEWRFDGTYGCSIWDHDFENIVGIHQWKDHLAQTVRNSIMRHEPRLSSVKVRVEITQESRPLMARDKSINRLKKCVDVHVSGNIQETNQPFNPPPQRLYVSPFSFD